MRNETAVDDHCRASSPSGGVVSGLRATLRALVQPIAGPRESDSRAKGPEEGISEISAPILSGMSNNSQPPKLSSRSQSPFSARCRSPNASSEAVCQLQQTEDLVLQKVTPGRTEVDDFALTSFHQHRRQRSRSRSRGPSSLRKSSVIENSETLSLPQLAAAAPHYKPLETLNEAPSQQNTPVWPPTAKNLEFQEEALHGDHLALDKRLPTLPNTPSSAYPPSPVSSPSSPRFSQQIQNLGNRFSSSSPTNELPHANAIDYLNEKSHFSAWTTMTVESTSPICYSLREVGQDEDVHSPQGTEFSEQGAAAEPDVTNKDRRKYVRSIALSSTVSCSTMTSSSTSPFLSHFDLTGLENNPKRDQDMPILSSPEQSQAQTYQLPVDTQQSAALVKEIREDGLFHSTISSLSVPSVSQHEPDPSSVRAEMLHSESMQQLIDELSYLSEMICR